ncbi:MAG TPA: transcription elongation factor GreA [Candidatus Parcubacteria bacterium]|nr:transcription elongation factor GreA [Candidatus Parcubacteria bacterium]
MVEDFEGRKFYLTPKGLKKIRQEYKTLKAFRAMKTNGEAPIALESEELNPEFASFREDIDLLDIRLAELENILKNAKVVKPSRRKNVIDVGATVELEEGKSNNSNIFTIVGTIEADPVLGKISNESPIGQALLGHKIGDKIVVSSPVKKVYKVKKIKYNEI